MSVCVCYPPTRAREGGDPWRRSHSAADADTSWKTLALRTSSRATKTHDIPPALRRRRFKCPECGAEKTVAETAHDGEVESSENEGGSAWGKDEGPWEG